MSAPPESLRELQRAFGAALLEGMRPNEGGPASSPAAADAAIAAEAVIAADAAIGALDAEALEIYRQTCRGALTGALATGFPVVRKLVGEAFFERCACAFIADHPPAGACLNDYGDEFPAFLQRYASAADIDYLADVARVERAFNRALHAADEVPLDPAALGSLAPLDAASLRLVPHPSVSVLRLQFPADSIWRAVLDDDEAAMAAIDLGAGAVWLLIDRRPDGVEVRRISDGAARFTQRLIDGATLQEALSDAAGFSDPSERSEPPEPLETVLADHFASGRFIAWRLTPASQTTEERSP